MILSGIIVYIVIMTPAVVSHPLALLEVCDFFMYGLSETSFLGFLLFCFQVSYVSFFVGGLIVPVVFEVVQVFRFWLCSMPL